MLYKYIIHITIDYYELSRFRQVDLYRIIYYTGCGCLITCHLIENSIISADIENTFHNILRNILSGS